MPAKPKLGQNFLRDASAVDRIVNALGDLSGRTVVEIGPGSGAITGTLALRSGRLIAVELDHELALQLRVRFSANHLEIVEQDILAFDLAEAASADPAGRILVAGNLPYGITSQILLKLAASAAIIDRAVLMVQREVADRITAQPGSRDYGVLSVTVQIYGPVEPLFTLPPSAFVPPPDVHSTVFRWRFAPRFAELGVQEANFLRLARQAFAQKRKTLANNLRAAGYTAGTIATAIEEAVLPAQVRAEAISLEQFAALSRALHRGNETGETAPHQQAPHADLAHSE
jgi:16S rRNA (adenine1518-N6/adenine1519-N6)-dimethyltransferase